MKKLFSIFLFLPLFLSAQLQGFGDSITKGEFGTSSPDNCWLKLLLGKLGLSISNYHNYGENSTTVYQAGIANENFINKYSLASPNMGGYVTIMYGTNSDGNNGSAAWIAEYQSLVQNIINYGYDKNKIILCSPPWTPSIDLVSTVSAVQQIATALNIPYANVYTLTYNHPEYLSSDNIHPNDVGHQAIANYVYSVIQTYNPLPVHFKSVKLIKRKQ